MSNIENSILDAIDILMDQKVSTLAFDRTVRASILEVTDSSIGKYKVKYQNSTFYAFSNSLENSYKKGTEVYVLIHSNDFEKDASIVGTVAKLGVDYLSAVTPEDRFSPIGNNVLSMGTDVSFCSYYPQPQSIELLNNTISVDSNGFNLYKNEATNLILAASFRTALPVEQQVGGGDYGIIVTCKYYNNAYKDHAAAEQGQKELGNGFIERTYVLNVDTMTGQPYRYNVANRQFAIFNIDGKNLDSITSIQAFCKDFSNADWNKTEHDIFIDNIEFLFAQPLTEEELQGTSLKITTLQGAYFADRTSSRRLSAVLKIKGNKVNYNQQHVDFYWFIKDSSITAENETYSNFAGAGWRCLNQSNVVDGVRVFRPDTYYKDITAYQCPSKHTTFKCVAVFKDGDIKTSSSAEIVLENKTVSTDYVINSSMGNQFAFSIGKTTLTVSPMEAGNKYYWAMSISDGALISLGEGNSQLTVDVSQIPDYAQYEVAIYNGTTYRGNASIVLRNGVAAGEYTLVLNNASQIFKYNAQGIAPTSKAIDEDERLMAIPPLSFDIYNDLGQKIALSDREKQLMCTIKWIWPGNGRTSSDSTNTMITTNYNFTDDIVKNPNSNQDIHRFILENEPQFTYGIQNRYDATRTDNNILLEVGYKGHHLTATTKFTFTKDGEIGTNGTKYIARIVPKDPNIDHIFVLNNWIKGYRWTAGGGIEIRNPNSAALKAQIWAGNSGPVYDQINGPFLPDVKLEWSAVTSGRRLNHKITLNEETGAFRVNPGQFDVSSTVQVGISTKTLNQDIKTYYAGYPIDASYTPDNNVPLVSGGYNHCMYESDGTRSTFNPQPFVFRLFNASGTEINIDNNQILWYPSWRNEIIRGKEVAIEPPDKYDATEVNNYIKVVYGSYSVIVSIDFYLNRYGLSAMNAWDGNSIKINKEGNQYILAPQIGAGEKNDDNSFTGVTMGKTFDASNRHSDLGLLGYARGERSFFLDAKTGDAYFGIAGKNQIQIKPSDGTANIKSGNYNYQSRDHAGTGMLIDFSTPYIQFGSDRFRVDSLGKIHAAGGGDIAGWELTDTELRSINKTIHLVSSGDGTIYSDSHNTLGSTKKGFYLSTDGLSIGSSIRADSQDGGSLLVGRVNGSRKWEINGDSNNSYIKYGNSGSGNSVYIATDKITLGTKFYVDNDGVMRLGNGAVDNSGNHWTINAEGARSYISYGENGQYSTVYSDADSDNNTFAKVYLGTDGISIGKRFSVNSQGYLRAYSGDIGGWTLSRNKLQAKNIEINSNGSIKVVSNSTESGWEINSNGSATFKNLTANGTGKIGGWTISSSALSAKGIRISAEGYINANYKANESGWRISSDGNAYFNNGKIGGWTISNNHLSGGQMFINGNGSMSGPGWSITNTGNASFNNISANKVFSFGFGANTWSSSNGFTFGNGSLGGNTVGENSFGFTKGTVGLGTAASGGNGISFNGKKCIVAGDIYANSGYFKGTIEATKFKFSADGGGSMSMGYGTKNPALSGLNLGSGGILTNSGRSGQTVSSIQVVSDITGVDLDLHTGSIAGIETPLVTGGSISISFNTRNFRFDDGIFTDITDSSSDSVSD